MHMKGVVQVLDAVNCSQSLPSPEHHHCSEVVHERIFNGIMEMAQELGVKDAEHGIFFGLASHKHV